MLRFAIALLAGVVTSGTAESADRALVHHRGASRRHRIAGGPAPAALQFQDHHYAIASPTPIRRPRPGSRSMRRRRRCTRRSIPTFPASRPYAAHHCCRAIMDRAIPTITRAPITAAPMFPIGTACPTPAAFTATASEAFNQPVWVTGSTSLLPLLFRLPPGQSLGLKDRQRQDRDRDGLMRQARDPSAPDSAASEYRASPAA